MSPWMADEWWCCDLRCHAPATFPGLTPRSVSLLTTATSRTDHRAPCFPPPSSPSWAFSWSSPPLSLISLSERKEERKICVLLYKSIKKQKDYRGVTIKVEVLLQNAEFMHYMIFFFFRGGMYRKHVNIVYFEFEHMENLIDKSKTN